jgi:ubiquinone/menaquinone biosynthesis C-methylase UbiE
MSFDTLAPHYLWMEWVLAGEKLQRCRTAFLEEIPVPKNVLLLGEGHGRCLAECVRLFPRAKILCVDSSQKMLEQSRRQIERQTVDFRNVGFMRADVLEGKNIWTAEPYDLVVTNFFLDCFRPEQIENIISKISSAMTAEANWLLADFQMAGEGFKKLRSKMILWLMYRFFRAATRLPARQWTSPDVFMERAGFELHRRVEREWALLHADWWIRK